MPKAIHPETMCDAKIRIPAKLWKVWIPKHMTECGCTSGQDFVMTAVEEKKDREEKRAERQRRR